MTDNRTNEQLSGNTGQFTEAQVKAAQQAWLTYPHKRGDLSNAENAMRAALVAAQGAAPQAEAYDHCCQHPKCPGGSLCCCASEQRLRDCWNQWREEVAGNTKQAFRDAYSAGRNDPAPWAVAPAPSGGVDEVWRGRIVTASFEDGEGGFDCGLEDCECPEHEQPPIPAGTYVTVRLDKDERVGLADVEIRVLAGKEKNDE